MIPRTRTFRNGGHHEVDRHAPGDRRHGQDDLAGHHGLEKIQTIGDAYMVVGGLPEPRPDHAEAVATMAVEMLESARRLEPHGLAVRIGIDLGPVTAGVIGRRKFAYDLWGDAVNTASRMESHGVPGQIHVTPAVKARLRNRFAFEARGPVEVKGKGIVETWFLVGGFVATEDAGHGVAAPRRA